MHKNNNIKMQTANQRLIEELYTLKYEKPMNISEIMKFLYIDKRMTQKQIAEELHVSVGTVNSWLTKAGVSVRKMQWI